MQIKFKRLSALAKVPSKSGSLEAGFDIATTQAVVLQPGDSHIFTTGIASAIDPGYCVVLFDRSGMGAKKNIHRLAGVIDCTYRGEWLVCLTNLSKDVHNIKAGDKIVQGLVLPVPDLIISEVDELDETYRGANGFGSTDVR